jgi:WD40 repeat protein
MTLKEDDQFWWSAWTAVSPDGKKVAYLSDDHKSVIVRVVDSGEKKGVPGNGELISRIAFSPDGTSLVAAGEGSVSLWDLDLGTVSWNSEYDLGKNTAVGFSQDGELGTTKPPRLTLGRSGGGSG